MQEYGLSFINKNRHRPSNNNPGEGVSIVFNPNKLPLKEFSFKRSRYELVGASGRLTNNTRPIFILGAYMSTKLKADQYHDLLDHLSDAIMRIKTENTSPYIILGGDFNRKDIYEAIGDYSDLEKVMPPWTSVQPTLMLK